jgi:small subunit ribosomal protein S8e
MAGRKISGGKYHKKRKKKLYELPGKTRIVRLANPKAKKLRVRGGSIKVVLLSHNMVNVFSKGKPKKVKIKNVLETPSNRFFARQNVVVKGAIVDTELGKVKITNRPSQEGQIQGVLIE